MKHHGKHPHPHTGAPAPSTDLVQGPPPGHQLEPDNYLLQYQLPGIDDPKLWPVLATILVDAKKETWTVDQKAAELLGRTGALHLTAGVDLASIRVPNAIQETTATVVTWTRASSPRYAAGFTFGGSYVWTGGTSILAITFEAESTTDGQAIKVTSWYNPDANPVNLKASGGSVTLTADGSGAYAGGCYTATSPLTIITP